jgi:hypothetical protein
MRAPTIALFLACGLLAVAADVVAQQPVRWVVEPRGSLAWWQMDPHFGHLWATTCPDDPSWQPGEGRSPSYYVNWSERKRVALTDAHDDRVPLYPRGAVRLLCRQAVHGVVMVGDIETWTDVTGSVSVLTDSLVTGLDMRDRFARRQVFDTDNYPVIRFTIEGVTGVQRGDTLRGHAQGTLELRGAVVQQSAPVVAWWEGEVLRVQAQFDIPAADLTRVYGMSQVALGMGVALRAWRTVHAGIDLVLRPAPVDSASLP